MFICIFLGIFTIIAGCAMIPLVVKKYKRGELADFELCLCLIAIGGGLSLIIIPIIAGLK